jgi:uncharacterized protein (DUF488 family)
MWRGALLVKQEALFNEDKKYLFTIGYKGKSLEGFLNLLMKNEIAILVDVRHNPISGKFSFSKEKLKFFL